MSRQSKQSFQQGSLVKLPRKIGFVWVLRYRMNGVQKATTIGTSFELPTESEARLKASYMIPTLNTNVRVSTFGQLIEAFNEDAKKHLRPMSWISQNSYNKYIKDEFGDKSVELVLKDLVYIKHWLEGLTLQDGEEMSRTTHNQIKMQMYKIVNFAMFSGIYPVQQNPIGLIKGLRLGNKPKTVRKKVPLTLEQYRAIVSDPELPTMCKVMMHLGISLGLRVSEILGLRWDDFDFAHGILEIRRSVVGKYVGLPKSERSGTVLPIDSHIVDMMIRWRNSAPPVKGWVFGNPFREMPYYSTGLQDYYLKPAAQRIGLPTLGWHTLRHTYEAFLRTMKIDGVSQMIMMRHSSVEMTNKYGRDGGDLQIKTPIHAKYMAMLTDTVGQLSIDSNSEMSVKDEK